MQTRFSVQDAVVIAGAGIAAAFTALRLLDFGFRPVILARRLRQVHGAETIPTAVLRWQDLIDVNGLLRRAGAIKGKGFAVDFEGRESFEKNEPLFYVERIALAQAALSLAVERGAALFYCEKMPVPVCEKDSVKLDAGEFASRFRYAVDATGRSAFWSRPVARAGRQTARIFSAPLQKGLIPGAKIITSGANKSWMYRIDLSDETNVGIVSADGAKISYPDEETVAKLGLPGAKLKLIARRPAFPQWTLEPCKNDRIFAVGDAAFAHNPIAGQGVSFALSSAAALAVVLRTCRDLPDFSGAAFSYYRELINSQKRRHLAFVENFERSEEYFSAAKENQSYFNELSSATKIEFSARVEITGLQRDNFIVPEEAVALRNGALVRWLGEFDLLRLKGICSSPVSLSFLRNLLSEFNLSPVKTTQLIGWCLSNGVLSASTEDRGKILTLEPSSASNR